MLRPDDPKRKPPGVIDVSPTPAPVAPAPQRSLPTFADLNSNPEFQRMTADRQLSIRNELFSMYVEQNPELAMAAGPGLTDAFRAAVLAPPSLTGTDPESLELINLGNAVRSGDRDTARASFTATRAWESGFMMRTLFRAAQGALEVVGLGDQAEELKPLAYQNLDGLTEDQRGDRAKAYEFFMSTMREDFERNGGGGFADFWLPMIMRASDYATVRTAGQGLKFATGAWSSSAGATALAPQVAASNSRLVQWFLTKGLPGLGQSVFVDGPMATIAEINNENLIRSVLQQPELNLTFTDIATRYSKEVAIDYLFFTGVEFFKPIVGNFFRAFSRPAQILRGQTFAKAFGETTEEKLSKWLREGLSPEELAIMPKSERIAKKFFINVNRINAELGNMTPDQVARAKGFSIIPKGLRAEADIEAAYEMLQGIAEQKLRAASDIAGMSAEIAAKHSADLKASALRNMREAQQLMYRSKSWDLIDLRSGTPKSVGSFGSADDALTGMMSRVQRELNARPQDIADLSGGAMPLDSAGVAQVRQQLSAKIAGEIQNPSVQSFRKLVSDATGELNASTRNISPANVRTFLDQVGNELGPQAKKILGDLEITVVPNAQFRELSNIVQGNRLFIPQSLDMAGRAGRMLDETTFGNKLLQALDTVPKSTKATQLIAQLKGDLMAQVKRGPTPSWINQQAQRFFGEQAVIQRLSNGEYLIRSPQIGELRFASETSFAEELFRRGVAAGDLSGTFFEYMQTHLKQNFGMNLKTLTKDGQEILSLRDAKGNLLQFADIDELVSAKPFLAPKLPIDMAPYAIVDVTNRTVRWSGNAFIGGVNDAIAELSKYDARVGKRTQTLVRRLTGQSDILFDKVDRTFELRVPELNWTYTSKSAKELADAMADGVRNTTLLNYVSAQKGAQAVWTNNGWMIRTLDGKIQTAANLDEYAKVLRELPANPVNGRDLLDLGPEINEMIEREFREQLSDLRVGSHSFALDEIDTIINDNMTRGLKPRSAAGKTLDTVWGLRNENSRKLLTEAADLETLRRFNSFETTNVFYNSQRMRAAERANQIWKDVPAKERPKLLPLFEHSPERWDEVWANLQGPGAPPLPQRFRDVLEKSRRFYDELSTEFGIDVYKFHTNYLPRIRKFAMENVDQLKKGLGIEHADNQFILNKLRQQFGEVDMKFFAENMRTKEFFDFVSQTDPLEVMNAYIRQGYRNKFLVPAYNEVVSSLKNSPNLKLNDLQAVQDYLEDAMGWHRFDAVGASIDEFWTATRKKLESMGRLGKPSPEELVDEKSFVQGVKELTVAATMSFRPGLAFRNAHQIYTVGSMLLPIDSIQKGAQITGRLLREKPEQLMRRMIDSGIIQGDMTMLGAATDKPKGIVQWFNRLGMSPYMNSDALNRMSIYNGVESLWDQALSNKARLGASMSMDDLRRFVNTDALPPGRAVEVWDAFRTQGPQAAKHIHGRHAVEMTNFSYTPATNPKFAQGSTLGRLFGTFMHYPIAYTSILRQTLQYQKGPVLAATLGRAAAGTLAIAGAHQMMGLDPSNYTPWGQAVGAGGPHFRLMLTAMDALNTRGYQGAQARSQLLRDATSLFMPGASVVRNLNQAMDLADKGDTYGAMLKVAGFAYQGFD